MALLVGALALMGAGLRSQLEGPLRSGTAPDFSFQTFEGESLQLSDHRGQVVLVNFWASWCVPCRDEAPILQAAYEEWAERGLVILGLNWVDTEDKAREFIAEFGLTYPNGPDVGQRIARRYRMSGIPETYFIARDGRLAHTHVGPITAQVLERQLLPLLEEDAP